MMKYKIHKFVGSDNPESVDFLVKLLENPYKDYLIRINDIKIEDNLSNTLVYDFAYYVYNNQNIELEKDKAVLLEEEVSNIFLDIVDKSMEQLLKDKDV